MCLPLELAAWQDTAIVRERSLDLATLGTFVFGLGLLTLGGEALVRGSSAIARRFAIPPLVIGLTVVAFGTSAPELVVGVTAVATGADDLAVGNVVGSNVFNVLAILGACALLRPLVVSQQVVVREVPVMLAASLLVLFFGLDGRIVAFEGALLTAGLVWFCWDSIREARRGSAGFEAGDRPTRPPWIDAAFVALGLVMLVLGARALVSASVEVARAFGVDEAVIGLTIVAAGTSLPEVAASIVATLRGERDIAVGNVIGSNVFNLLGILGIAAMSSGTGITVSDSIESFDLPVMTAVAAACLPLMARGRIIARWQGGLFFGYYVAYTTYLVLAAQHHAALPRFSAVMLEFVLPFTAATIAAWYLSGRRRTD